MGSYRVLRGGSWNNNANNCRSANRNRNNPRNTNNNNGFRVCRSVPSRKPPWTRVPVFAMGWMLEAHRPSVGGVARSGDRPQRIVGLWPERVSKETTGLFPRSRDVAPPEQTNTQSGQAELVGASARADVAEGPACPWRPLCAKSDGSSIR